MMSIVKALELFRQGEVFLASGSPRRREIFRRMEIQLLSHLAIPESVENLDPIGYPEPREYVLANVKNKLAYALEHLADRVVDTSKRCDYLYQMHSCPERKLPTCVAHSAKLSDLPGVVIAADTIVVAGHEILEKPTSPADNYRMMQRYVIKQCGLQESECLRGGCWTVVNGPKQSVRLSAKHHDVMTAVSFIIPQKFLPNDNNLTVTHLQNMKDKAMESAHTFAVTTKVKFMPLDEETITWYVKTGEGEGKAGGYAIQGLAQSIVESIEGCFYNVVGFPIHQFLVELDKELRTTPKA